MELNITTASGESAVQKLEVADATFTADFNEPLVHQVVTAYLAASRAGTKAQKTRSAVSGGGAKPFRQKGTGRARAGSIRSPIWRGGGKVFAATPRDYSKKVNRKMYRGAMRSILSELVRQERLVVVDDLTADMPKTKELVKKLQALSLSNVLIVTQEHDENLYLSARNIPKVDICSATEIDPVNLIRQEKVLITVAALKQVEERLA